MFKTKETFSVLFYLKNTGKKTENKPENLMTIMGRITVNGEPKAFSTKCRTPKGNWNQDKQQVRGYSEEAKKINPVLKFYKDKAEEHYNTLFKKNNGKVTVEQVYSYLFGKFSKAESLIEFFEEYIRDILEPRVKIGDLTGTTRNRYLKTKERLAEFIEATFKISDIGLNDIYPMFITRFYLFIRDHYKDCHNNGALKYVQKFRTIILSAIANGIMDHDPFANYEFKWDKYDRGYLIEAEIIKIMQKKFEIERLERIRDLFLFACFTGLGYKDMKKLTRDQIRILFDGETWISENRSKTDIESRVLLLDIPKYIIAKYEDRMKNSQYVLPMISNQKLNAYLKELGDLCGINKNITFYLARHTFATTVTLSKGVPIETVSKMLGHTNITTTQIYARIVNERVSNDMQILKPKLSGIQEQYTQAKLCM